MSILQAMRWLLKEWLRKRAAAAAAAATRDISVEKDGELQLVPPNLDDSHAKPHVTDNSSAAWTACPKDASCASHRMHQVGYGLYLAIGQSGKAAPLSLLDTVQPLLGDKKNWSVAIDQLVTAPLQCYMESGVQQFLVRSAHQHSCTA